MTKKFNCPSVECLINELFSEGGQRGMTGNTFLEIVQLKAYDSDSPTNKPTASAEIICGKDTGVPYCMCITKDYDATNNDGKPANGTFNSVFDAVLKKLTNSPSTKSNSR